MEKEDFKKKWNLFVKKLSEVSFNVEVMWLDRDVYEKFMERYNGDWTCLYARPIFEFSGLLSDLSLKEINFTMDDDNYDWYWDYGLGIIVVEGEGVERREVLRYGDDVSKEVLADLGEDS